VRPSLQPTAPRTSDTDFGREVHGETLSLSEALRKRTGQVARAEAFRYQLGMGLIGFFCGLFIVVPTVLWMAPSQSLEARDRGLPLRGFAEASSGGATTLPSLISAPTTVDRKSTPAAASTHWKADERPVAEADAGVENQIETARSLIRADQIPAARRLLKQSELQDSGRALFMLAETYDPNVLAALGATGVVAEAQIARRYYEAALAEGVEAAAPRLEALE